MSTRMRDHQRAETAFQQVNAVVEADLSKYRTMAMKLPALIQTGGITLALHFVAARGSAPQRRLLDHLAAHLKEGELVGRPEREALLAACRGADLDLTRRLTREAMRCLAWNRRFLQARPAAAKPAKAGPP